MPKDQQAPAVVIYNGPSQVVWRGFRFPGLVWGCNFAYKHFDLDYCWAVDRMTVAAIRGDLERKPYPCEFWTKETSLELPPQWQHRHTPGIDSGSAAVNHALDVYSGPILIIGADGVCGGHCETLYQNLYPWHANGSKANIHQRHRQTLYELNQKYPGRLRVVWDHAVDGLETMTVDVAKSFLNKYHITEANDDKTSNLQKDG